MDVPAASVVQIKEEQVSGDTSGGTGIDLETQLTPTKCTNTRIAFPAIANFATGVKVGSGCTNADIYEPAFLNTTTTISDSGTNTSQTTSENGLLRSVNILVPNETVTGTQANRLAKLTSSCGTGGPPVCAINADFTGAMNPTGAVGVVIAGAGKTGSATIAISGVAACKFDGGGGTAGDFVAPTTLTPAPGGCRDAGTSPPSLGESIGVILQTNGTGGSVLNVALLIRQ